MRDDGLQNLLEAADALAGDPPRVRTSWEAIRRRSARRQFALRSAAGLALAGIALGAVTLMRARSGDLAPGATPQQLLAELRRVTLEADARTAAFDRAISQDRGRAGRTDRTSRRPPPIDPEITARVQIDRAAAQLIALGDEYERRFHLRDQAAAQYRLVLHSFPDSAQADEARTRLAELRLPEPDSENPL